MRDGRNFIPRLRPPGGPWQRRASAQEEIATRESEDERSKGQTQGQGQDKMMPSRSGLISQ